jgi:hypothetical protein
MKNLGIFYDQLVYFTAIGNILWPFGIFCGNLVYFSPFGYFGPRKIWQPCVTHKQGFHTVYLHTNKSCLGRVLEWKMLVRFRAIWNSLRSFEII